VLFVFLEVRFLAQAFICLGFFILAVTKKIRHGKPIGRTRETRAGKKRGIKI
jgi:hypothetical protein